MLSRFSCWNCGRKLDKDGYCSTCGVSSRFRRWLGRAGCGLGFSRSAEWNATVRVTTGSSVAEYKIDRWD